MSVVLSGWFGLWFFSVNSNCLVICGKVCLDGVMVNVFIG